MVNNNNNSSSNTNNNNKQCQICLKRKRNSTARCFFNCKGKTCNKCINKVRKSGNPSCPTCRRNIRQHPLPRPNGPNPRTMDYSASRRYAQAAERQRIIAAARRARNAVANGTRGVFQEPPARARRPSPVRLTENQERRILNAFNRNLLGYPPTLVERMYQRSGSTSPPPRVTIPNNRGRRSGAPSPEPRPMHTGGLVRKTGPHRLLKDEIVLSRAQRKGLTHGQIVKILKAYKKSK